ncbi:E3 ubiquitin-protein ligase sina-like [Ctenocephalides felis]|uniref:E3 ubiquitin-protein ligase sina-like n=1 Tax=Ctenocephalides felis TaxID=7515 RepID=UPI000E6E2D71|nr:E3 ubiquitin-protein ligase sina-like [Ctenocephalides felis]
MSTNEMIPGELASRREGRLYMLRRRARELARSVNDMTDSPEDHDDSIGFLLHHDYVDVPTAIMSQSALEEINANFRTAGDDIFIDTVLSIGDFPDRISTDIVAYTSLTREERSSRPESRAASPGRVRRLRRRRNLYNHMVGNRVRLPPTPEPPTSVSPNISAENDSQEEEIIIRSDGTLGLSEEPEVVDRPPEVEEAADIEVVQQPPASGSSSPGPIRSGHYRQHEQNSSRLSSSRLNHSLLNILLCPVCWEYITPPINQCKMGHLICASCKGRLMTCPTCRSSFAAKRNLAMEKVANKLMFPCTNDQSGCRENFRYKYKADHEANCVHRLYKCVLQAGSCSWTGKYADIFPHSSASHSDLILKSHKFYVMYKYADERRSNDWIICAHKEIFHLNFAVNRNRDRIYGTVHFLGPKRRASEFIYTIRASSEIANVNRVFEYSRTTHDDHTIVHSFHALDDCFVIPINTIRLFGHAPEVRFDIEIKKK